MTALEKPAAADTHHVASGQKIQAAIDASANGDEIEVATGIYYESIDFKGKAVRLYSSGGPSQTTIYGYRAYHVVKCVSGEGSGTILEGFTITGGNANGTGLNMSGGGMLNNNSSPTVINCIFGGNYANASGGGMFNYGNAAVINCTFIQNAAFARGGGMYNYGSPTVTNCKFTANSSDQGGAVYNYGSPSLPTALF